MKRTRAVHRHVYESKLELLLDVLEAMEALERGGLIVITGCMCSSKTRFYFDLLFELLESADGHEPKDLLFKPEIDTRYGSNVGTYDGFKKEAHVIKEGKDTLKGLIDLVGKEALDEAPIIAFEESELFPMESFPTLCEQLVALGKLVIVIGLNLNWLNEPFGPMLPLTIIADEVVKLFAECPVCRRLATHTQHYDEEGQPAEIGAPKVEIGMVGAGGTYKPVCRFCRAEERKEAGREIPLG